LLGCRFEASGVENLLPLSLAASCEGPAWCCRGLGCLTGMLPPLSSKRRLQGSAGAAAATEAAAVGTATAPAGTATAATGERALGLGYRSAVALPCDGSCTCLPHTAGIAFFCRAPSFAD
jgi:hypothetical protein